MPIILNHQQSCDAVTTETFNVTERTLFRHLFGGNVTVKLDGNEVTVLSNSNSSYVALVAGTYTFTTQQHCRNTKITADVTLPENSTSDASDTTGAVDDLDTELFQYCNTDTDTIWLRRYQFTTTYDDATGDPTGVSQQLVSEVDTTIACQFGSDNAALIAAINALPQAIADADGETELLDDFCYEVEQPQSLLSWVGGTDNGDSVTVTDFDGNGTDVTLQSNQTSVNPIGGTTPLSGIAVGGGVNPASVTITFSQPFPLTRLQVRDLGADVTTLGNFSVAPIGADTGWTLSGGVATPTPEADGFIVFDGTPITTLSFDQLSDPGDGHVFRGVDIGSTPIVGKAYKVLDEDGTFIEYRDRITDVVVNASAIVACDDDSAQPITGQVDIVDVTPKPDQTHVRVTGTNSDIPAGLKNFTVVLTSGSADIDGFILDLGVPYSERATESDRSRSLLPSASITASNGSTWKWIGLQPVSEA